MKKKTLYKKVLAGCVLIVLFLPILQGCFGFVELTPLRGAYVEPEKPVFTFQKYFSGDYQNKEEIFISKKFGFSEFFIRLYNQIDFTFFSILNANSVKLGKEGYLFDGNYIKSYNGENLSPQDSVDNYVSRLKFIQDTLSKLNKTFVFIISPGKGYFFPEYIPEFMYKVVRDKTNYDSYLCSFKKSGINVIDFNGYFMQYKKQSPYLLYPKTGIHWSYYGKVLAMDSIVKYLEDKRKEDLPNIYWDEIEMSDARGDDKDIEEAVNLLFKINAPQYAYPKIQFEKNKKRPSVLTVGDSFYGGLFMDGFHKLFNEKSQFWYYNVIVMSEKAEFIFHRNQFDLAKEVQNHDIIMISSTEANLQENGWNWVDKLYRLYHEDRRPLLYDQTFKKYISQYKENVKTDVNKYKRAIIDAERRKLSVDSVITIEASCQLDQDLRDQKIK